MRFVVCVVFELLCVASVMMHAFDSVRCAIICAFVLCYCGVVACDSAFVLVCSCCVDMYVVCDELLWYVFSCLRLFGVVVTIMRAAMIYVYARGAVVDVIVLIVLLCFCCSVLQLVAMCVAVLCYVWCWCTFLFGSVFRVC